MLTAAVCIEFAKYHQVFKVVGRLPPVWVHALRVLRRRHRRTKKSNTPNSNTPNNTNNQRGAHTKTKYGATTKTKSRTTTIPRRANSPSPQLRNHWTTTAQSLRVSGSGSSTVASSWVHSTKKHRTDSVRCSRCWSRSFTQIFQTLLQCGRRAESVQPSNQFQNRGGFAKGEMEAASGFATRPGYNAKNPRFGAQVAQSQTFQR